MTFRRIIPTTQINDHGHYQLKTSYDSQTLLLGHDVDVTFCTLDTNGLLLLKCGFYWNGPSGGVDTAKTLMPSAVYDCLCELIALGYLPPETRKVADKNYQKDLRLWDVMTWKRKVHKWAIKIFGPIYGKLGIEDPLNKA